MKETTKDAIVVEGMIQDIEVIKNPFYHNYKFAKRKCKTETSNAYIVTISNIKYYFMV